MHEWTVRHAIADSVLAGAPAGFGVGVMDQPLLALAGVEARKTRAITATANDEIRRRI
jgi:hypothetical protein